MNTQASPYSLDTKNGVWQRSGHTTFAYSDGDEAENRINAIVSAASDLSVLSTELRKHISDWPSNYHLSSQRANLLRPLKNSLSGTVLEIGSGCGAITRFLGETARSVVALEGSHRRAQITRARTRDLSNVEVYCDEFSAFTTQEKFDAVTLIGVLEYANMFVGGPNAALDMLTKVKAHLSDKGCLVIAIENQLGLKYFAGAPEDHLGKAMLGIEDQYTEGGVRTYSKQRLTALLRQAGFEEVEFLYPFPDYKMPASILSDEGLDHETFDPVPFLVSTAGKDPQLALEPSFSLERTWPVLADNGLTATFSNSFLIVASPAKLANDRIGRLAWHYSTQRKPEFCKETVFSSGQQKASVAIERTQLAPKRDGSETSGSFHLVLDEADRYSPSPLLSSALVDLITRPNWTYEQLAEFLRAFARHVSQIGQLPLITDNVISWDYPVPGNLYDCVPQNICVQSDGSVRAFDLEWHNNDSLPFHQLAFRGLWSVIGELTLIGQQNPPARLSLLEVIQGGMAHAGRLLTDEEAQALVQKEIMFQRMVSGAIIDVDAVWSWMKEGSLRQLNSLTALAEAKQTMTALSAHIEQDATHIAQLKQHANNLSDRVRHVEKDLESARERFHADAQAAGEQAEQNSLQSSAVIRRLTQQSALRHVHAKSLKGLIKRLRDYRNVRQRSNPQASNFVKSDAAVLISAIFNHWDQRPSLITYAHVIGADQATQLMKQSCHWPLPFSWYITAIDQATLDNAETSSRALSLETRVSLLSVGSDTGSNWAKIIDGGNAFVAIPKTITENTATSGPAWPLPDAEWVRLAYGAMHCDPSIAAVYLGLPAANPDPQPLTTPSPAMCLIRTNEIQSLPAIASLWQQHLPLKYIEAEIEALRAWAAANGKAIIVL